MTSACYSPRLEKNIGFAMMPIEHTELGTELKVETPTSGKVHAVVVPMPHWDPKKEIPETVGAGAGADPRAVRASPSRRQASLDSRVLIRALGSQKIPAACRANARGEEADRSIAGSTVENACTKSLNFAALLNCSNTSTPSLGHARICCNEPW